MKIENLKKIVMAQEQREAIVFITRLEDGMQTLMPLDGLDPDDSGTKKVIGQIKKGISGVSKDGSRFAYIVMPAPRLIIVGAVHIAQYLTKLAKDCGFEVTVIDPREAFATKDRFVNETQNVKLMAEWPQDVWEELKVDKHTAVVALAHDPKIDDYPLSQALNANCFYVGALGSKKTHEKRIQRLQEMGVKKNKIDNIHAPIGLDISASGAVEIAVAIIAEIIKKRREEGEK